MVNRIQFNDDSPGLPCKSCGFPSLRVATIVRADGTLLGRTVICTACEWNRHRVAEAA